MLLPVFLLLLFFPGKYRIPEDTAQDLLSKEGSVRAKGFAATVVFLHHLAKEVLPRDFLLAPFLPVGFLAVAVFYFYSGYGLTMRMAEDRGYKKGIPWRMLKIFLPFMLINLVYMTVQGVGNSPGEFLCQALGFHMVNCDGWYVPSLLIFYFGFYVIYSLLKGKPAFLAMCLFTGVYIAVCAAMGMGMWWFVSTPAFLFGILAAKRKERLLQFFQRVHIRRKCVKIFIVAMVAHLFCQLLCYFGFIDALWEQAAAMLSVVALLGGCFGYLGKLRLYHPFFKFLGEISYEFYLIHRLFLQIFKSGILYISSPTLYSFACAACAVFSAVLFHWVFTHMFRALDQWRNGTGVLPQTVGNSLLWLPAIKSMREK